MVKSYSKKYQIPVNFGWHCSMVRLANRRTVNVRPQIIEYEHRNQWLVPAPACLHAGQMVFIMLMRVLSLFILSGHCMLSGCNASIIDFLLISEVPSDSLFLKQFDSVS